MIKLLDSSNLPFLTRKTRFLGLNFARSPNPSKIDLGKIEKLRGHFYSLRGANDWDPWGFKVPGAPPTCFATSFPLLSALVPLGKNFPPHYCCIFSVKCALSCLNFVPAGKIVTAGM
jgi:hypothetical protein